MEAITIKAPKAEKEAYKAICKEKDTTMSQELRKFIKREIKEYEENKK